MSRRTRTMAVLLSGAALIGGGTASAADAHNGHHGAHHRYWHGRHHDGLARAASELGVTKDALKAAIKSAAEAQQGQAKPATPEEWQARKDAFYAAVAQTLGTTADKVEAALGCKHGDRND